MENIVKQFKGKKVLVVGDLVLDSYLFGKVRRMSPEGIHPLVNVRKMEDRKFYLGGACNVASNLRAFGAEVYICGVTGDDKNGDLIIDLLSEKSINTDLITKDSSRPNNSSYS